MKLDQALLLRIVKFGIVGFTGVVVDFITTYLLKEFLKVQKYIASSIGFVISAIVNFTLNRLWTFENHDPAFLAQFFRFFGVALIGLSISLGITYLLNERLKLNFYVSKALSIGGAMIWNFLINSLFTFR
jgi:putative flippase GtrA